MVPLSEIIEMHERIAPFIKQTPLESFAALDESVGNGIKIFIKPLFVL